jgi:cold shock CspA family protein
MNGEIVWYSPEKRYGFVAPVDGGADVVFRLDDSGHAALGAIERGMAVHFLLADSPAGPVARDLAPGHIPEP